MHAKMYATITLARDIILAEVFQISSRQDNVCSLELTAEAQLAVDWGRIDSAESPKHDLGTFLPCKSLHDASVSYKTSFKSYGKIFTSFGCHLIYQFE